MNYVKNLDIGESLTSLNAQKDMLKIPRGYLLHYEIRLYSGTDAASTLKIQYHGTQIMPTNREEALTVMNIFHRMPAITPLLDPPFELEFISTNSALSHNYVSVALFIVDPKMLAIMTGLVQG